MARSRNWFPRNRAAQLTMGNIPASVLTELHARTSAAETALTEVQNEDIRTPVAAAQCREGFRVLEEGMRDIKKRYFYVPPLQESDLVSLGLKIHKSTAPPSCPLTAQVTLETFLVGRYELGIKIVYVIGSPNADSQEPLKHAGLLLAGRKPYSSPDTTTFETGWPAPCRQKAVLLSRYNNL